MRRPAGCAGVFELEALSAPALTRLIADGVSSVVVPFGSIEHQAGHLAIGADAILADAVGRGVADRLGAVLAPTIRVGCAEQHRRLAGTLTCSAATLTELAVELAESLGRQGFKLIVLVSTHGGNGPALNAAAARVEASLEGVVARAPRGDVGPAPGAHSGVWLTSAMLALRPDLVELERVGAALAEEVRAADADRGRRLLERYVAGIVEDVQRAAG